MGKGKLAKFADMASNPRVVERPYRPGDLPQRLDWHAEFFHNDNPIVLELGCGRGEYTVGMGRTYPQRNFIGVDIKGARMWTGAQEALRDGLDNVGFLRTNIEFIDQFFSRDEVSEIWLTFSDPQMKKPTKRLTSTYFLQRYRHIMRDGGIVHLKTDSNFLFTYTEELLRVNAITPIVSTRSLYEDTSAFTEEARSRQTYYEEMWRSRGISIKYLSFHLPQEGTLVEPEVDIPLDEYRSYGRQKRSGSEVGK